MRETQREEGEIGVERVKAGERRVRGEEREREKNGEEKGADGRYTETGWLRGIHML